MIATIIKIQKKKSRYGGYFYYAFFKGLDGKSYYSCLYERLRNWTRWKKILNVGITLSNLKLVKGKAKIIDADSKFVMVEEK